jgi:hypothetical protein
LSDRAAECIRASRLDGRRLSPKLPISAEGRSRHQNARCTGISHEQALSLTLSAIAMNASAPKVSGPCFRDQAKIAWMRRPGPILRGRGLGELGSCFGRVDRKRRLRSPSRSRR